MQVGIDVKCMHTNFGGRGLSGFGDKISLWSIKVEKFNRLESAQKIHATRGQCYDVTFKVLPPPGWGPLACLKKVLHIN